MAKLYLAPAAPSQSDIQAAANYYGVPADVIDKGIVDSYKAELYQADQQAANVTASNFTPTPVTLPTAPITSAASTSTVAPSPSTVSALQSAANNQTVAPYSSSVIPSVSAGNNFTGMSNNLGAQSVALSPSTLALAPSTSTVNALQSAANQATVVPVADTILAAAQAKAEQDAQTQREIAAVDAEQQRIAAIAQKATDDQAKAANIKVTNDTLATLGGTGTTKVADAGTVVDKANLNTQGGESALATSPATGLTTSQISTLDTKPISTLDTKPIGTLDNKPITTLPTAGTQALTTADLASWGKTLPQGITADQLTAALKTQQDTLNKSYSDALAGNQTALTSQNEAFLKNWNTSADALKNSILSGVDTKNQAFGTQATQGFMDAFKNFQIPTNQQPGVNLGNYNDNRNAAADQWWSQYVTGRR